MACGSRRAWPLAAAGVRHLLVQPGLPPMGETDEVGVRRGGGWGG